MLGTLATIEAAPRSPTFPTLEKALTYDAGLTRDSYALARVVASEFGQGEPTEMCCIADAIVNHADARGLSLFDHITERTGQFGSQGHGSNRKMSSKLDPGPRHVEAALAIVRRGFFGALPPPLRGVAKGAYQFMDPKAQTSSNADDAARNCPPLAVLESWTYARKILTHTGGCELADQRGGGQLEWVGPIPGVDAYQLMLFRAATAQQDALYAAARRVIESRGSDPGQVLPLGPVELVTLAGLVAAAWLLSRGGLA